MTRAKHFIAAMIFAICLSANAQIPQVSGDLKSEIVSIVSAMPGSGSNGFVIPSFATLQKWSVLFNTLVDADFLRADSIVKADFPYYQLIEFTDTGYQNRVFYMLKENAPIERGWGTFLVNPDYLRQVAIEVPHARYDTNTHREGADVFRETGARFLLMSGTHRCANSEESSCSGTTSACGGSSQPYRVSDMAHFENALFQLFHEVVTVRVNQLYSINLHGHAQSSCPNFFMSSGVGNTPTQILLDIKAHLLNSGGVTASVAGDGTSSCSLTGGTNTQGRFTNGSSNPCNQAATTPNGYFMHIEQSRNIRDNYSLYSKLIAALNANIQPVTAIAPQPVQPATFGLFSAYPNPFNPTTTLVFSLEISAEISLKIFDNLGREVQTVAAGQFAPGEHAFIVNAASWSGGSYFAQLRSATGQQVLPLFLTK